LRSYSGQTTCSGNTAATDNRNEIMRIVTLNTPYKPKFSRSSRSPAVTKGGTIYYPLWLAYTTGVLEKNGHKVKLIDAPAKRQGQEEVLQMVKNYRPELIVAETSTGSIYDDVEFVSQLKRETGAYSVLVGTHPSALPEETLKISEGTDAVARHEYDYIIRDLASELEKVKPNPAKVRGLTYRHKGKIKANPDMPLIENLDELPFVSKVYRKHLNYRDYFYSANLWPEVTILSGRGCPYQCRFCLWPQTLTSRRYRARSTDNVLDEFEYIEKNFPKVKEIFIEDDTFTSGKAKVLEFAEKKEKRGIGTRWSCNSRADIDLETLAAMKKSGCRLVCVGIESAEQKILNNIRKGTTVGGIRQFMKDTKKAGVLVHGCFILGNEGETEKTIRKTIDFAKELNPDTAQFFPLMVYPGTEVYEWARKNGYLTSNDFGEWLDSEGQHNCMISRPDLSSEALVAACNRARKEFYLRPAYMLSKAVQAVMQPEEAPRILRSAKALAKNLLGA
jgi:radical SAM superfamily enzyme YgiQ (UPF0313 family)